VSRPSRSCAPRGQSTAAAYGVIAERPGVTVTEIAQVTPASARGKRASRDAMRGLLPVVRSRRLVVDCRDARNQANPAVFDRRLDRWLAAPTDVSDQTSCDRFVSCANLVDAARQLQDRRPATHGCATTPTVDVPLGGEWTNITAPAGSAARRRSACSSDRSKSQATTSAASRRGGRRRPRRRRRSPPGLAAFVLYGGSVRAGRAAACSARSALALV